MIKDKTKVVGFSTSGSGGDLNMYFEYNFVTGLSSTAAVPLHTNWYFDSTARKISGIFDYSFFKSNIGNWKTPLINIGS